MDLFRRSDRRTSPSLAISLLPCAALLATLTTIGCASPGPPRAPSLHLPEPVRNLTAERSGNTVELHFTAPTSSTDKLPLRSTTITGQFCRQLPHQPCIAVPSSKTLASTAGSGGAPNPVTWTDSLPPALTTGPAKLLSYRVELFSPAGRSAGLSEPAFTATGPAPAKVENLHAQGTRLGILVAWNPSATPGDVLLYREDLAPKPSRPHKTPTLASQPTKNPTQNPAHAATPSSIWLGTQHPGETQTSSTLDTTALPDTPYRYLAQRRLILELGGRTIELRSQPTTPITFTLLQIYPPPTPTGLTAVGYVAPTPTGIPAAFAVDLIWQPVDESGLITPLAGYNLYREPLNAETPHADARPTAARQQLNIDPILSPAFHDTTANPTTGYRYTVTAIDTKGNESSAATVLLEPTTATAHTP